MKLITSIVAFLLLGTASFAQDEQVKKLMALENNDTTLTIKPDTTLKASESETRLRVTDKDTTKIRFGRREIIIIEKDGSTSIEIPDTGEKHTLDSKKDKNYSYKRKPRFRGNWAGFEWGFNGLMDPNFSNNLQGDLEYLALKQGRSWNVNLNIMQYSLGLGTDKVGLVTGLGLEFNNFYFRNQTTIKVVDHKTVVDNSYLLDPNIIVTQSKLYMSHLTLPLLLEFQIPTGHRKRIFFSAGVVGGVRLASNTKLVYEDEIKHKKKIDDDFNLSSFRYGLTTRVGFKGLSVFATYYPVQLFEKNKGDEVYPFAIGLRLLNFGGS